MQRFQPLDDSKSWVIISDLCAPLEWNQIFANDQPVEIDLGAGDGGFVAGRAEKHPEINFLAVERLLGRARKIARKAARLRLPNLKVLRLESLYTVQYLVPKSSVAILHLMFPDPWPKRKHWGNRLVQPEFVNSLARVLKEGGEFRLTTDHEDYFKAACAVVNQNHEFNSMPLWDFAEDPLTDFQRQFESEGRSIYRARWKRN